MMSRKVPRQVVTYDRATSADVEHKRLDLFRGRSNREEASCWASQFISDEAEVKEKRVWNAFVRVPLRR